MDFILASGSIHRKELLLSADFEPKEIVTADIDETPYPDEKPVDYVCRMAKTKAEAVHALKPAEIILAADTIVVCNNRIIQKSKNAEEQRAVMKLLSGSKHCVLTAVCLIHKDGTIHQEMSETGVKFKTLSEKEIDLYVSSNRWVGCCGYNNDGIMESFTEGYEGSYSGLVGLPLCIVRKLFEEVGLL